MKEHKHKDCGHNERVWLERREGESATMCKHLYCVECGLVKGFESKIKNIRYFIGRLHKLKIACENKGLPKFTQSQLRLIHKSLESKDELTRGYLTFEDQTGVYVKTIQQYRPDIPALLIEKQVL